MEDDLPSPDGTAPVLCPPAGSMSHLMPIKTRVTWMLPEINLSTGEERGREGELLHTWSLSQAIGLKLGIGKWRCFMQRRPHNATMFSFDLAGFGRQGSASLSKSHPVPA